jgi:hypothetical protein
MADDVTPLEDEDEDVNQLARRIVEEATKDDDEVEDSPKQDENDG